jgi:hypothetical protein
MRAALAAPPWNLRLERGEIQVGKATRTRPGDDSRCVGALWEPGLTRPDGPRTHLLPAGS